MGNNIQACHWDGGDCCNNNIRSSWDMDCDDCQCLDPQFNICLNHSLMNDNYCHDANNVIECQWDGGDCCYHNRQPGWDDFCEACECLQPCPTWWTDNKYCNDITNIQTCNWDGGACCNNDNPYWDSYCNDCLCLDPQYSNCFNASLMNDGYCQDGNNLLECHWDGGDCCNNDSQDWDAYCNDCECLNTEN